jgi:CheY-like chemotaxis protein
MALVDLMSRFEGLELVEAEDGMHAWELIDRGMTPGAILSDLHMPRLTGIELLRKVRNKGGLGDLPFVLVTSSADLGTVKQAMTLGIDHYIVKPFNAEATEKSICRTITNAWNNGYLQNVVGSESEISPALLSRKAPPRLECAVRTRPDSERRWLETRLQAYA